MTDADVSDQPLDLHVVGPAGPGITGPDVAERVLEAAVAAVVPRRGRRGVDTLTRPAVPVPGWSTVADGGSPGPRRGRTTRRALLLAAARVFAARGFHGASVADVLDEVATVRGEPATKGALYFHFGSKHDLARCLVAESLASWDAVVDVLDARAHDPIEAVLSAVDAGTGMLVHDPIARAARRIRVDDEMFAAAIDAGECRERERLVRRMDQARAAGLLRTPADPRWTVDHVCTVFAGHHAHSEKAPGYGSDLWASMGATWQSLLPAIAVEDWLVTWRASGWTTRPRPDPDDYRRARHVGSE